jgi:hypothetical protein
MAAAPTGLKEIAVTVPGAVFVVHGMGVIFSIHRYGKFLEVNPVAFCCIPFSLLNFTDHPIIHGLQLLSRLDRIKKGHAGRPACLANAKELICKIRFAFDYATPINLV